MKPDPNRGWEIINELEDGVDDQITRNIFVSHSRNLESFFTNGFISEDEYRTHVNGILQAVKKRLQPDVKSIERDVLENRILKVTRDGVTHITTGDRNGDAFAKMQELLHPPEQTTASIKMAQWQGAKKGQVFWVNTPEITGECVVLGVENIKRGEDLVHFQATGKPNPTNFTARHALSRDSCE